MRGKFSCLLTILLLCTPVWALTVNTKIVGVKETENGTLVGVVGDLYVEVTNGTGKVFVETIPLTKIDTQASARLAKEVSCEILAVNCSNFNFYYTIRTESIIIGGPSAGAAMTIATLAALSETPLRGDIIITGTINPDGSIGPVGGVFEKAKAAFEYGAKKFLIPKGERIVYMQERSVVSLPGYYYEEIKSTPVDIVEYARQNWGLEVIEVMDIREAFEVFTNRKIIRRELESVEEVTQAFNEAMLNISNHLLNLTYASIQEVQRLVTTSRLNYRERNEYLNTLSNINQTLGAPSLIQSGKYYSASSQCIDALRRIEIINLSVRYKNNSLYLREVQSELNKEIEEFKQSIYSSNLSHHWALEAALIALSRLSEAKQLVSTNYSTVSELISGLALARAKLIASKSWYSLINRFMGNESIVLEEDKLKEVATRKLEEAYNAFAYASTLETDSFLSSAYQLLRLAQAALDGRDYVYALFKAAEAKARANLVMEIRGLGSDSLAEKVKLKNEIASQTINEAEALGVLPFLGLSYKEFASTTDDPTEQLIYLSYAKEFAKISIEVLRASTPLPYTGGAWLISKEESSQLEELYIRICLIIASFTFGFLISILIVRKA
ncbi:MAG: S16 family serine protease [Candidatus Nanoarchaeia archaeon]|nr:hypothetical protein [Candidatus Haiyanarchaeum thermophilum]MCW1302979.1 hypothetical protein [Candidatus Haiyanarchaeum thermophilum]MCW1303656.1 hypothetical protein [Candidatus Haiyanarchaeum thermophilum]MCW1306337.1 hypothetical protein [Candidatus Haiyanarchaeum thermophilum]MCW1307153.1 hypothetical protein [Candidatus Haiyanarchaeum thermophilum]